ncbi:MAG: YdeI/OmpD-associated family protein [Planctomycetes bacterium]|nr:YdeI/OmpD-associated family protein [Planctomycetota bacterium]
MPTLDPRVDAYIDAAPAFARPILTELRARVHAACPAVVETIKWRMPSFEFAGLLAGMAAFKAHCTFGFWKNDLLKHEGDFGPMLEAAGCLKSTADLPPKARFAKAVKRAMVLNQDGVPLPRKQAARRPAIAMHPEFRRALAASTEAQATFDAFARSCQREYLEWIAEAKKDDTRARRIEQAVAWLAAGKKRHWKYESC